MTTLFASIHRWWVRWQADRAERAIFNELVQMEPHLLDDIGLSINDVATALEQRRTALRHSDRLAALTQLRASSADLYPSMSVRSN